MIKINSDPTYCAWANLLKRERSNGSVCERWLDCEMFLEDVGERPDKNHILVRLDRRRQYTRGNCVWIIPPKFVRKIAPSEYSIWVGLRQRCHNPKNPRYKDYGGRGITVCERWDSFDNFIEDVGWRTSPLHTLDRKDNSKGYSKENCHWALHSVQMRNTRRNRWITIAGRTQCLTDWANEVGIHYTIVIKRLRQGYSESEAVYKPLKFKRTRT